MTTEERKTAEERFVEALNKPSSVPHTRQGIGELLLPVVREIFAAAHAQGVAEERERCIRVLAFEMERAQDVFDMEGAQTLSVAIGAIRRHKLRRTPTQETDDDE